MHLQHPAILVCLFLVENETKVNIEIIAGKLKSSWIFLSVVLFWAELCINAL